MATILLLLFAPTPFVDKKEEAIKPGLYRLMIDDREYVLRLDEASDFVMWQNGGFDVRAGEWQSSKKKLALQYGLLGVVDVDTDWTVKYQDSIEKNLRWNGKAKGWSGWGYENRIMRKFQLKRCWDNGKDPDGSVS